MILPRIRPVVYPLANDLAKALDKRLRKCDTLSMTNADLFTKAATARLMGGTMTPQAVAYRVEKLKKAGQTDGIEVLHGVDHVTRAWIDAWKAERKARGQSLIDSVKPPTTRRPRGTKP